ncbi:AAA family ATPase [Paenibacillus sp. 19GGS1-52]|uniref:AAA family ATPase n=1 Tax=Paenibacillus sp. 19GGS1-52 TaxID=2758563 RepID=UPI001EFA47E9|nr:AAA family ATPase [Paenibacillus sp. 19GGS1-52]ULO06534.1 AAA family ATPase [Paenibacillus sp. 19GGS1-52]
MRIRIIGACGSGKSTLAKELSQKYGVSCYELDNLVWDRSAENLRFPIEVRDSKLAEILNREAWIVEGVHYKWGEESFARADLILILTPNKLVRDYRVVKRFIRTRMGMEQWNYKQSWHNLYQMIFEWNRGYDREAIPRIMEMTAELAEKRKMIKNTKAVETHIQAHFFQNISLK